MTIAAAPPIERKQAYCRGCAQPTFLFDPAVVYPPHMLYCDNCYGTATKYTISDEDGCGCEEDDDGDYRDEDGHLCECEAGDPRGHGNTTERDAILPIYDWQNLLTQRGIGHEQAMPNVDPARVYTPPAPVFEEPEEEEDPVTNSLLEHTCSCGSTEFRLRYTETRYVTCHNVDLNDAEIGDEVLWVSDDSFDHDYGDDDDEEVVCADCSSPYTGEWRRS